MLFRAQFFYFMGEVEAVFGIWLIPLFVAIIAFHGWSTMVDYVGQVNVADAIFVVVIMAIASSLPILRFTETLIAKVSAIGKGTPASWWLTILTLGPLLGSFITGPAAMTICALLLRHRFYSLKPSQLLKYATLGLLFVNISVGGVLTQTGLTPAERLKKFLFLETLGVEVPKAAPKTNELKPRPRTVLLREGSPEIDRLLRSGGCRL